MVIATFQIFMMLVAELFGRDYFDLSSIQLDDTIFHANIADRFELFAFGILLNATYLLVAMKLFFNAQNSRATNICLRIKSKMVI